MITTPKNHVKGKIQAVRAEAPGHFTIHQSGYVSALAQAKLWNSEGGKVWLEYASLIIQKLHYRHEVRDVADVPGIKDVAIAENEIALATTLVEQMSGTFAEIDNTDQYHVALKAMLERKVAAAQGLPVAAAEAESAAPVAKPVDIMEALKASLALASTKPALRLVAGNAEKAA